MKSYIIFIHGLGKQPDWEEESLRKAWTEALGY